MVQHFGPSQLQQRPLAGSTNLHLARCQHLHVSRGEPLCQITCPCGRCGIIGGPHSEQYTVLSGVVAMVTCAVFLRLSCVWKLVILLLAATLYTFLIGTQR